MADEADETTTKRELPAYKCHKKVWALKIKSIEPMSEGRALICPSDEGYVAFVVSAGYVTKHDPKVGGYFVQYEDGYRSFSPSNAFESGYTRL